MAIERLEVELDANVNKFKQGFKQASNYAKDFGSKIKKELYEIKEGLRIRAQIKQDDINEAKARINDLKKALQVKMPERDANELRGQLQATENQLSKLANQAIITKNSIDKIASSGRLYRNEGYSGGIANFSGEFQKANNEGEKFKNNAKGIGKEISTQFSKGLRSIRRLTLGFIGARSLFALFRQQVNAYRGENEAFNQQMMLTSNIITTALAPAFEFFGNMILYATLGLAKIIDIMFGTNIAATVLAKGISKADKASADLAKDMSDANDKSKEFADNLLGLDEITNLNEQDTGTGMLKDFSDRIAGINAQNEALDKFKKAMQDIDEWFKKHQGITKFFKTLGTLIKDFVGFLVDHPIAGLLGIGAFATLKALLPAIAGGLSTGGLIGIAAALTIMAGISIAHVIEQFNDLKDQIDGVKKAQDDYLKSLENLKQTANETDFTTWSDESIQQNVNLATSAIEKNTDELLKNVDAYNKEIDSASKVELLVNQLSGKYDMEKKAIADNMAAQLANLHTLKVMYDQGVLNEEQQENYKNKLLLTKKALQDSGLEGKNYNQAIKDINGELKKLDGKGVKATIDIDADTSKAQVKTNNWISDLTKNFDYFTKHGAFATLKKALGKATGGIFTGSWQPITAYAGGGLPDAGQMFVAREAGPEMVGTIGGHTAVMNNDQIVASVSAGVYQAVLSAMGGQSDRPIVLNINGKEFAKATYSDYQEEGTRRGANTSIRRS